MARDVSHGWWRKTTALVVANRKPPGETETELTTDDHMCFWRRHSPWQSGHERGENVKTNLRRLIIWNMDDDSELRSFERKRTNDSWDFIWRNTNYKYFTCRKLWKEKKSKNIVQCVRLGHAILPFTLSKTIFTWEFFLQIYFITVARVMQKVNFDVFKNSIFIFLFIFVSIKSRLKPLHRRELN